MLKLLVLLALATVAQGSYYPYRNGASGYPGYGSPYGNNNNYGGYNPYGRYGGYGSLPVTTAAPIPLNSFVDNTIYGGYSSAAPYIPVTTNIDDRWNIGGGSPNGIRPYGLSGYGGYNPYGQGGYRAPRSSRVYIPPVYRSAVMSAGSPPLAAPITSRVYIPPVFRPAVMSAGNPVFAPITSRVYIPPVFRPAVMSAGNPAIAGASYSTDVFALPPVSVQIWPATIIPPPPAANGGSCGGVIKLPSKGAKYIKSPNYPKEYPRRSDCVYAIIAPKGKDIKLQFLAMNIEKHARCVWDFIEIFKGGRNGKNITKLCSMKLRTYKIKGGRATVYFHSDGSVQKKGFKIKMNAV